MSWTATIFTTFITSRSSRHWAHNAIGCREKSKQRRNYRFDCCFNLKITHALTDKYEFLCNFVSITTNGLICDHDSAEPWWGECVRAQARLRLREDPEILWLRLLIQRLSKITTTSIKTPSIWQVICPLCLPMASYSSFPATLKWSPIFQRLFTCKRRLHGCAVKIVAAKCTQYARLCQHACPIDLQCASTRWGWDQARQGVLVVRAAR